LERVLRVLKGFGISKTEAEVYVYLAKKGPKKETELAIAFQVPEQQLFEALKNLENKGLVASNPKRITVYSALDFQSALELLIKNKIDQAREITELKKNET
jgi:sugar-specific transcriptional regulator TrmB